MQISQYNIHLPQLHAASLRIVQVSDVHFSIHTSHEKNMAVIQRISAHLQALRPDVIAVTGDLLSRNPDEKSIADAAECAKLLCGNAKVFYTFGNHETDCTDDVQQRIMENMKRTGVEMLCNRTATYRNVDFAGYVLPQTCYKNERGGYFGLAKCRCDEIEQSLGKRSQRPTILLAHNPMGLPAYAQWGADVVLSGHVHGGIVRIPILGGILSPERKFFPKYTKGRYEMGDTVMLVSAGIGKLRIGNPPELVCIDLTGEMEK